MNKLILRRTKMRKTKRKASEHRLRSGRLALTPTTNLKKKEMRRRKEKLRRNFGTMRKQGNSIQ